MRIIMTKIMIGMMSIPENGVVTDVEPVVDEFV